jgi:hypothetical protein
MIEKMNNDTDFAPLIRSLVLALLLALFVVVILWTARSLAEVKAEMKSSTDALKIAIATAQQSRASARDNAYATGTALGVELDNLRATATARAPVPTSMPAQTPTPTWPISIEECDSYDPLDRARYMIESEIESFILSFNRLLSAMPLTSCAQNYGDPYFEWLTYYIGYGLHGLDFGLRVMDPEWREYRLEQLPTPETDQG